MVRLMEWQEIESGTSPQSSPQREEVRTGPQGKLSTPIISHTRTSPQQGIPLRKPQSEEMAAVDPQLEGGKVDYQEEVNDSDGDDDSLASVAEQVKH